MTRLVDIAEKRLSLALERADALKAVKVSKKISISRRTDGQNNNTSIKITIPSDLVSDRDEFNHKPWQAELLVDGSILFRPL
jgi:hypothetical protein